MEPEVTAAPTVLRLAAALVDGAPLAAGLEPELVRWLAASPRVRALAVTNEAKIRKKLRGARDAESVADVRAELRAAALIAADGRATVAWEAYGSGRLGPDFTVTVPGRRPVNVEVTRLRRPPELAEAGAPWLAKLRQLPPSVPNVIVVAIGGASAGALDVAGGARIVRARAEARDDAWFTARGLAGARWFNERSMRLAAVITWCEAAVAGERVTAWSNPAARIALPALSLRDLVAALGRD